MLHPRACPRAGIAVQLRCDSLFPASCVVTFDEVLEAVEALLREHGRVTYRGLRRRFNLDDEYLQDVRAELVTARRVARDEGDEVLVYAGPAGAEPDTATRSRLLHVQGPQAERRQLTVMFCDLRGSTALAARLDPEEWREVMRGYHEVCSDAVRRYEGHIAQYLGDGVLIYFGYPVAHDDDAVRSVHAGLEIIDAVGKLGQRLGGEVGELAVRVGVHTGLVVVGEMGAGADRREQLALGDTPNVAARVQSMAAPHQLLVTEASRRLLGETFQLEALGPQSLRGVGASVPLYIVQGVGRAPGSERPAPGVAPLVGRVGELQVLESCFHQAEAGSGQLVTISADAGLGKSRLVDVLRSRLRGRPHVFWEWRCSAYHVGTALHPVVVSMGRLLGLDSDALAEQQWARIEAGLQEHGLEVLATPEHVADLAALLGCPPLPGREPAARGTAQQRKRRTLGLVTSMLCVRAEARPVCLVVEDLHWADPSTRELLGQILALLPKHRIMVLTTERPRPGEQTPTGVADHTTVLTLAPLSRVEVQALAQQVAAGRALPPELIDQLAANTDGVPLFVEELTTMVLEAGALEQQGHAYVLTRPISTLGIPSTLQGSLMARLDHLSSVKSVAQLASVLGREFTIELLVAVAELPEAEVALELQRLVSAGVLKQRGTAPHVSFVFRHALIQEAAYQSLLKRIRQRYHSRVAAALLRGVGGDPERQPEQLALHYEAAGEIPQAVDYYHRAGVRAAEASALAEAADHLMHALSLLNQCPGCGNRDACELRLRLALGAPLIATRGYASREVAELYDRTRALSANAGDPHELFRGIWGLFLSSAVRADFGSARKLADVLDEAAGQAGDAGLRVETRFALAHCFWTGGLSDARAHCEHGLAEYDELAHADHVHMFGQDPEVGLASYLSWILWLMGETDAGRAMGRRAIARARQRAHSHSLGFALAFAGVLEQMADEPAATLVLADELIEQSKRHDHPTWLADGEMLRGWAVARGGDYAGLSELQRGLDSWDALGARLWRTHQLVMMADACLGLGELGAASDALRASAAVSAETAEVYYNADAERLWGRLALARGGDGAVREAREHFERGLQIARGNESLGLVRRLEAELAAL